MSRGDDDDEDRPRRRRRDEDDDDEDRPRRRRRRDDDDYPDVRRRPRRLSGMDGLFANTNIVLLVLFPLCCGFIALILGVIGLATCKDETAKQRALMVTIISGIMTVIGIVLSVTMKGRGGAF